MDDRFRFRISLWGPIANALIADGGTGRIAAVFTRSFYLESAGGMACIGDASLGIGPLNAICDAPPSIDWPACGLRPDAIYKIAGDDVHIAGRFVFSTAGADTWSPPRGPATWWPQALRQNLDDLERMSASLMPLEGLAPLVFGGADTAVTRAAREPVAALRLWLTATAPANPLPWVRALAGLGPGLTPSGDDFLGGVMIVLHVLGQRQKLAELGSAVREAAATSNPISRAHLDAAAGGLGSAAIHNILCNLLSGNRSSFSGHLDAVDRIGHCSGWDALAGIVTALRASCDSYGNRPASVAASGTPVASIPAVF